MLTGTASLESLKSKQEVSLSPLSLSLSLSLCVCVCVYFIPLFLPQSMSIDGELSDSSQSQGNSQPLVKKNIVLKLSK